MGRQNDRTRIFIGRRVPNGETAAARAAAAPLANRGQGEEQHRGRVATGTGLVTPVRSGPLVCVATPELHAISETFIGHHISGLPMPVCVLQGRPLSEDEHGQPILGWRDLPGRLVHKATRTLLGQTVGANTHLDRALAAHLRRHAVAIVLAEYGVTAVEILEACRRARIPLVAHFHGYDAYAHAVLKGVGRRYRELFEFSQAIVVVSRHMRDHLVGLGASAEKLHVIPCGVDTHLFGEAHPGTAPPRFLAVGRFVEKKAPYLLVVAMSRVVRACPDARLTVIGSGPLLDPCRNLARALQVDHAVTFAGAMAHDAVARQMREARAFVQHSITTPEGDREGTPVAIQEAMVSGLPVIATRHGGIVECVAEGNTGLLVDEQDVERMAEHMVRLARNAQDAARLGGAARAFALDRFALDGRLKQLAAVLRDAISGWEARHRGPQPCSE